MTPVGRVLSMYLRVVGGTACLAAVAVVMPTSWIDATHRYLGLGPLPPGPIVGYLARSTSAFYALLGGLMLMLSFDLRRYRPVLVYLSFAFVAFGVVLCVIDRAVGLPIWWSATEGPLDALFGVAMLWLTRRAPRL